MNLSFADRDLFMRYFGGGVGHQKSAKGFPAAEDDDRGSNSDAMAVDDPALTVNEDVPNVILSELGNEGDINQAYNTDTDDTDDTDTDTTDTGNDTDTSSENSDPDRDEDMFNYY